MKCNQYMVLGITHSMKLILNIIILLFWATSLYGQESRTFQVIDENNEPVPFAHVHFKNTMNGTISNVNGEFRITSPNQLENPILVISSIGYLTKEVSFDDYKSSRITLPEDVIRLNEVVVIPKDYERELLYKALRQIPNNYPIQEERHSGFAREFAFWDENEANPIYVAESTLESVKGSYERKNANGHVSVSDGRRYVDEEQMATLGTTIIAGSHHLNRFDAVGLRNGILSNDKNYELEVTDTLRLYNENLYKLSFKKGEDISGYLLIIDSTYAIVEAYYEYTGSYPFSYKDASRQFMNYQVNYEKSEDDKWRYKHSKYHTSFRYGRILTLKSEFVSTQTKINVEKIPYLERIHHNDAFINSVGAYDSSFWDNYTIIIPDQGIDSLFRKSPPDISSPDIEFQQAVETSDAKRFRSYFELSYIPIDVNSALLSFSNEAISFGYNENAKTDFSFNYIFGLSMEVRKNLWAGIRFNNTLSDRKYNSIDFEITKDINLNPNGRPILVSPKLVVGHQWLNHPIGSVDHAEDYTVNGKEFDSGKTNLYLHERGFHLSPMISLGLEKNQVVRYFLSFGTNLFLTRSTGVMFNEDDQFFLTKKNEFLKEGEGNLNLATDGSLLSVNWMINFGIYLGR